MTFMVQFTVKPGNKNKVVELFEQRGPSRNPGVTFRGGWIAAHADVVFVLVDSAEESLVSNAAKSWSEVGDFHITEVIDFEKF